MMKKIGLLIAVAALTLISCTNQGSKQEEQDAAVTEEVAPDMHTSETSLDWAGVYEGTMPCASCEGIETVVELRNDHTYTATYTYMGTDEYTVTNEGSFTFDVTGNTITLKTDDEQIDDQITQFKVGENQLTLLGADGEVNTGELAEFYVLQKKM